MLLELEIREPNRQPQAVTIRQPKTVIGRSSRADIKLSSNLVSSSHANLKVYSDGCVVEDLRSSNGTFVNGHRITAPTDCPNGTKIQIGEGGPMITILSGSREPPSIVQSDSQDTARATAVSEMALWLSGGIGVVLIVMVLFCGVGAIGMAIVRSHTAVSDDHRNGPDLNDSVALVYCGWRVTESTGTASEEPTIVNVLGVDEISDEAYVSKFVKEHAIGMTQYQGKTVYFEQLLGSSGTGFPITSDGFVLTNKHVIEEAVELSRASDKMAAVCKMKDYSEAVPTIWVFFGGEPYPADVVHVSQTYDLAIIKCIKPTTNFFSLSTVNRVERGMEVSAIGFPGVVSDLNKAIAMLLGREVNQLGASGTAKGFLSESDLDYYQTFGRINSQSKVGSVDVILHGAKINHGNSGGPLVSTDGVVLAINTWGDSEGDVNASQILSQMRSEIDDHVPGVRWVK